ncbi:MAG: hypothetical protein KA046_06115 [Longilinea sp.]|nr:hypothetical protein [Longilinea sp.]
MRKSIVVSVVVVGILAVAVVLGAGAVRTVSAASLNQDELPAVLDRGGRGFGDGTDEDLAAALGITVDELTAARDEAKAAMLEQAVADGLITQAQADELTESSRVFPFGGRWNGWLGENGLDYNQYLADALGISVDELESARLEAFEAQLTQAVEDGRLTQEEADLMIARKVLHSSETFQAGMQSAYEEAVNQAVTDGTLTQVQADLILENMGERGGFFFGGGHRRGGR